MAHRLASGKEQDMGIRGLAQDHTAMIAAAITGEYRAHAVAAREGDFVRAWHHLERAHILAQTRFFARIVSHWRMLVLSLQQRDWREAAGQLLRLALAPVGNLADRLPIGNTGRSTVSAFAAMDIPPDLQAILDHKAE